MLSEFWLLPARPDLWPAPATVRASGSRLPSSGDSQGFSVHLPPKGGTLPRWGVSKWMCLLNLMVIFCQPTFPLGLSHWLPNVHPDCGFVYCAKKLQLSILYEILLQRI